MTKKNKNILKISVVGQAAEHVTGSGTLFECGKSLYLAEFGMSQRNSLKEDYRENNAKFDFKISHLAAVVVGHSHLDHIGRLPLLVKRGYSNPIYVPEGNKDIMMNMLLDAANICERNVKSLSIQMDRDVEPIYTKEDAAHTVALIKEIPFNELYAIDDTLIIKFIGSGHIAGAAQIEMYFNKDNITKKVLYTSDLGNIDTPRVFQSEFQQCECADVVIGEATYGDKSRPKATKQTRKKDREKIKTLVEEVCNQKRGKILIPCFALERLPLILSEIYEIFHGDETFRIPVIVDSPLGQKNIKAYIKSLPQEKAEYLCKVLLWENVIQVNSFSETLTWCALKKPCIILASSGMLQHGRSVFYLEALIGDYNNHVVIVGYSPENTISYKIKNGKSSKYITIDSKMYRNACGVTCLNSFSSHMQYEDLLDYYSSINCQKIVLVHSQMETKIAFSKDLEKELSKKLKTAKVIAANSSTTINI